MSKKPVVLMVLDGYGLSDHKEGEHYEQKTNRIDDFRWIWIK